MKNRNEPALDPWLANYLRRAIRLRRKLSDKALAARFNVSIITVSRYGNGKRGR